MTFDGDVDALTLHDQIALGQGAGRVLIGRLGGKVTMDDFEISVRVELDMHQEPSIRVIFSFRPGVVLNRADAINAETSFHERPVALEVSGRVYTTGPLAAGDPESGTDTSTGDETNTAAADAFFWVGIVLGVVALGVVTAAVVLRARTASRKLASFVMTTPLPQSYFGGQRIYLDRANTSSNHFYPEAGPASS